VSINIEFFRGKHKKTKHCNLFLFCLLAITSILKILKNLGQEGILSTKEEILVEFLAFE